MHYFQAALIYLFGLYACLHPLDPIYSALECLHCGSEIASPLSEPPDAPHRSRLPGASIVTRLPTGVPAHSKYQGAPFSRNTPSLIAAFLPIERVDPFPVTGKPLRPAVVAQPAQFLVPRAVLSHLTYSAVAEAVDFLPAPPEPRALSP